MREDTRARGARRRGMKEEGAENRSARRRGMKGEGAENRSAERHGMKEEGARPKVQMRCEQQRMDYTQYRFSKGEILKYLGLYLVLDGVISYLFFYSLLAFFILLPGCFLFLREQNQIQKKKRASEMRRQFLDGIQMTSASLQAGYSVENAFREAAKELGRIYKEEDFIMQEFRILTAQMDVNRNAEDLLMDLGRRSGVEDIMSFAEVFMTAKRSGGDLMLIIRNTASCIRQKHETLQEIETCLSGKVMEQNIMSLVPVLILAYVKLSSPEFLDGMYGNLTGTTVMTVCFAVYVLAYVWGKRIVQIEV